MAVIKMRIVINERIYVFKLSMNELNNLKSG